MKGHSDFQMEGRNDKAVAEIKQENICRVLDTAVGPPKMSTPFHYPFWPLLPHWIAILVFPHRKVP